MSLRKIKVGIDFLEEKKKTSKRNKEDQRKDGETPEKLRNELAEHKKEMEEENQTISKKKAT